MHEHSDCEHELKYCKVCDVCWCKKCKREWGGSKYWYINTAPTYPPSWTVTTGWTSVYNSTAEEHRH